MRILFDHQIFQSFSYGGVSRYFAELLRAFQDDSSMDARLSLRFSDNLYLRELPKIGSRISPIPDLFPGKSFRGKKLITRIWQRYNPSRNAERVNRKLSLESIARNDWDIFHPTYYDDYFLELIGSRPYVVTVYDLIYELFPRFFPKKITAKHTEQKRKVLAKASRIIAISECTKRDIIKMFGIDPDKIHVIYLGGALHASTAPVGEDILRDIPERYLLYVGSRSGYKNFDRFIESVAPLLRQDAKLYLVCSGPPFTAAEVEYLRQLHVNTHVIWKKADDAALIALYKNALAFVFPSLYEGFGIPVLEAFEYGCPAILSAASSLPEVGGSAAVYFSPTDNNDIRKTVERVVGNASLRDELRILGKKRALKFSWSKTARETKNIYQKIMAA